MSVTLHPKYGLNPTIPACFYCGGEKNEVVLLGIRSKRLTGHDRALMRGPAFDKEPCDECKGHMRQGIIIIEVRDGESGENPYRTGGWWVVRQEAVERMVNDPALLAEVIKRRAMFMEQSTARLVGLAQGTA